MLDEDCAICCSIRDAIENLAEICRNIDMSCQDQRRKKDFGLERSYIIEQIKQIQLMQKWHQYYHIGGNELTEDDLGIGLNNKPAKGRRFRPPFKGN